MAAALAMEVPLLRGPALELCMPVPAAPLRNFFFASTTRPPRFAKAPALHSPPSGLLDRVPQERSPRRLPPPD